MSVPAGRNDDVPPSSVGGPHISKRVIRDLASVALVLAGLAGLLLATFTWEPLAGWAMTSVYVTAAGFVLGLDR